jgi:hypothetical protein
MDRTYRTYRFYKSYKSYSFCLKEFLAGEE